MAENVHQLIGVTMPFFFSHTILNTLKCLYPILPTSKLLNNNIRVKSPRGISSFLQQWFLLSFHTPAYFLDTTVQQGCLPGCWGWVRLTGTAKCGNIFQIWDTRFIQVFKDFSDDKAKYPLKTNNIFRKKIPFAV